MSKATCVARHVVVPLSSAGVACNGCWARFEGPANYEDNKDTKEARTWHKFGPRVAKPEEVAVGQGWIVKAVEDDDLGR